MTRVRTKGKERVPHKIDKDTMSAIKGEGNRENERKKESPREKID